MINFESFYLIAPHLHILTSDYCLFTEAFYVVRQIQNLYCRMICHVKEHGFRAPWPNLLVY